MVASRRPSLIENTAPSSNPDTSPKTPKNNKNWDGSKITKDPSSFGRTEVNRGHLDEKGKFIPHGNVQDQFKKLGPPPPLPPIPKHPPSIG